MISSLRCQDDFFSIPFKLSFAITTLLIIMTEQDFYHDIYSQFFFLQIVCQKFAILQSSDIMSPFNVNMLMQLMFECISKLLCSQAQVNYRVRHWLFMNFVQTIEVTNIGLNKLVSPGLG